MSNMLKLIRLNLLWFFKYRCNISGLVWFAMEDIPKGSSVLVTDWRLHIVRVCKVNEMAKSKQELITTKSIEAMHPSYFAVRDIRHS